MKTSFVELPCTQKDAAEMIGLPEALQSLDKLPELRRQLEIYMLSWTVAKDIYETVKDEQSGHEEIVFRDKAFPSRVEKDFFALFQQYVDPALRWQAHNACYLFKPTDTSIHLNSLMGISTLGGAFAMFFEDLNRFPKEAFAGIALIPIIMVIARLIVGYSNRAQISDHLRFTFFNEHGISGKDIANHRKFLDEGAPLRMISDFYESVQAFYKAEKVVEANLASNDEALRAKGAEIRKNNQSMAKSLVRYAAAIEVELKTTEAKTDAGKLGASMARLEQLAGTSEDSVERLHEMDEAMREVNECLLAVPPMETRVRIAESCGRAKQVAGKVAVIDAEFEEYEALAVDEEDSGRKFL